jgi:hypothetical protein
MSFLHQNIVPDFLAPRPNTGDLPGPGLYVLSVNETSRQSDRRKSRIACLSDSESALKRWITVLASDGP